MRFHVVSLPHTQTTEAFSSCAYTEKVRKFCRMMMERGHTVFLYAGDQNEAPCTEHISCIGEAQRLAACAGLPYTQAPFDASLPHWIEFNANAIRAISPRIQKTDFICIIGGVCHKMVADAFFPMHMTVEFGIGYGGSFSRYRVFESYAWMHTCYGARGKDLHALDGEWFDAVIPGYLEIERFPFQPFKDDYYLYMGRLIDRKGWHIAEEVCRHLGKQLIVAGDGPQRPTYGEYFGIATPQERGLLMSKARAVFTPTIYIEPFGNVAIEAMACGTPVISTDWGAFTETVVNGLSGYRCRTFKEFVLAAELAPRLDPYAIREHAQQYSLEAIAPRYEAYFERLLTLWNKGWYDIDTPVEEAA